MDEDIFTKPPVYGRVANWLGPRMLARLLDFVQIQRDSFVQTTIGHKEAARIDLKIRRSSRAKSLGDLKEELRTRVRAILPVMLERLGTGSFEPSRLDLEMVAHGDGAL